MTSYINPTTHHGGADQIVVPNRVPDSTVDEAPFDDAQYVRVNGEWVPAGAGIWAHSVNNTSLGSVATGNILIGNWVPVVSGGNISPGAAGTTINVPGYYEVEAWGRIQTTSNAAAQNGSFTICDTAGSVINITYFACPANLAMNYTPHARYVGHFDAGNIVKVGFGQTAASFCSFIGGAVYNGFRVKLLKVD
jgi:hypothetical protein